MPGRSFAAATLLCALAVRVAPAQTGDVTGTVVSRDSVPVALAQVAIAGIARYAIAERNGHFRLAELPAGKHSLVMRMIGFSPITVPVEVRGGDTLTLRIDLTPLDPLPLGTVEVQSTIPFGLRAFEERRGHGPGYFMQYEDIAKTQARQVTDVLRRIPGIQVRPIPGPYGTNLAVMQRGSRCPVMFFLNGSPFPINDVPINNYVAAEDLIAVEAFTPSELPPQFNSVAYASRCGVVGLWTRAGNLPDRARG